jgi:hypothetical protein
LRQAALAALLLAAVVGTVYVAAQDGGQGAIAALANAGGEAALERELAATKAQLAREASIISALKTKEGQFKAAFSQASTTSLAAAGTKRGSGVRVQTQQLDGEAPAAADPAAAAAIDPARQKKTDAGDPDKCPVIYPLHKAFSPAATVSEVETHCRGATWGCIECKKSLHANVVAELAPIREKAAQLTAHPGRVTELLDSGADKARTIARETMRQVKDLMGLPAAVAP